MKNLFITMLVLLLPSSVFSQKISLNQINSQNVLEIFNIDGKTNDFGSTSTSIQIGDYNELNVLDKSSKSDIIVRQVGDYNNTLFINPEQKKSDTEIDINGHNNYIDITGSNSISDGMKIRVNANDKMIFVRNY